MSEKVILILADGLRPDAMMACGHPFAEEMKAAGITTDKISPMLLPTYTHGNPKF